MKLDPIRLKTLLKDLEAVRKEHADVISEEPQVQEPLDLAIDRTRAKYKKVTEGRDK